MSVSRLAATFGIDAVPHSHQSLSKQVRPPFTTIGLRVVFSKTDAPNPEGKVS